MAAIVVILATFLSRIFGFAREVVMAKYFGAGAQIDAYRAAYTLPNIFRLLLADVAISSAFIPVFSSYLAKGDRKTAWRVASNIINLMMVILGILIILGIIFAPQLVALVAPGYLKHPKTFYYSILLTRILFPSLLFLALGGVIAGILNSYEHFAAPAVAPIFFNLFIIALVIFLAPQLGIISLAIGVVAGSLAQFLFQLPALRHRNARYRLSFNWRHPGVQRIGLLLVPIVISQGAIDINLIVDTRFASTLATGSVASLGYAARLWTLPVGLFAFAVSTVLFPTFSRQVALGEIRELKQSLSFGLRALFLVLLPAMAGFLVLTVPIVRLIFERGEFTARATLLTSSAVFYYSIGLFAIGGLYLINRAFYALKDMVTPMIVALISIIINYFGDWTLMKYLPLFVTWLGLPSSLAWLGYPHGGIALSTSIVSIFNMTVLLIILRNRIGGFGGRRMVTSFAKISIASIVLGLTSFVVWNVLAKWLGLSTVGQIFSLGGAIVVGLGAYLVASRILRIEEIHSLREMVMERFGQ